MRCGAAPLLLCLLSCAEPSSSVEPSTFAYAGIDTRLLDNTLVNFVAKIEGDAPRTALVAYAECAAAQYALIRGFGFARHVRTSVYFEGSHSVADAVYTVSPSLPRGVKTIDAEVVVDACRERGIPTV